MTTEARERLVGCVLFSTLVQVEPKNCTSELRWWNSDNVEIVAGLRQRPTAPTESSTPASPEQYPETEARRRCGGGCHGGSADPRTGKREAANLWDGSVWFA